VRQPGCGRLAERGISVTVLEAGKRFDPATDLANSEANAAKIMWTEPRVYAGGHSVIPKTGVGVGGGTLTWLGVMPRFSPTTFRTRSAEGVGSRLADRLRRPAAALRAGRA
jgi:choline dehydrogenase-like flavoprotein